jgi:CheY-like chemotaxis protein
MTTTYKVLVFEDRPLDAHKFCHALENEGCEVQQVDNARCEGLSDLLSRFEPDFCVVDCEFEFRTDGLQVIRSLQTARPGLPVVVCSRLLDHPSERDFVVRSYRGLPGVRALIGKKPFPTGAELLRHAGLSRR